MGPVSFERLEVGTERAEALAAAVRLRAAGVRVDLVAPTVDGAPFLAMIRSHDASVARAALDALGD